MRIPRAEKLAVVLIALAFAAGGFVGVVAQSPEQTVAQGKAVVERGPVAFDPALPTPVPVSREKINAAIERMNDNQPLSAPTPTPDSTLLSESFEDDVLGAFPDDPPWYTEEVAGQDVWTVVPGTEGTVGENPPAPWQTVDGVSETVYWQRDYEDTYAGQGLTGSYHTGTDGYFGTFNGDVSLTAESRPAGSPAGAMIAGNGDSMAAYFDEGVAGDATVSYFGPSGVDDSPTSAYCAAWFYLDDTSVNWGDHRSAALIGYDYTNGMTVFQVSFYALGEAGSTLVAFWGDGQYEYNVGTPVSGYTWHELAVLYDESTETFDVYLDGALQWAGLGFAFDAANGWYSHNLDSMIIFGGDDTGTYQEPCRAYIDNFKHFLPATGGTHDVTMTDVWAAPWIGGNTSIYLDQNGYAAQAASATYTFTAPYAWGIAGVDWYLRTSTATNSNGATFIIRDFAGNDAMGLRLSGGNIQYYTAGSWVTLEPYVASKEYYIALTMNTDTQTYTSIWVNNTEYVLSTPVGNPCGGLGEFVAMGTVGTQSEIYFDAISYYGTNNPSKVNVSADFAHTGVQSVHMNEKGAMDYSILEALMTTESYTTGSVSFWFRAEDPFGAQSVILYDSTGSGVLAIVSMGADYTGSNNPSPGELSWIYGDGMGGGWITSGGTFTTGVWNSIQIDYNYSAATSSAWFTPYFNGVPDPGAPYLSMDPVVDAAIIGIYGEAPYGPGNFYYDDISFWADTPPTAVSDFTVEHFGQGLGPYQQLFLETFSGTADATWIGDDGGETAPSDEWWDVAEAAGDTGDILVGNYNGQASANSLEFIDCDDDWGGQWAVAHYGGGNNWFDLSSFEVAFINLSVFGAGYGNANEGWRLEVTTNGGTGWSTAIQEVGATAIHGWQNFHYDIPSASMTNQFGFRINCAGSANTDIGGFDNILLWAAPLGAPTTAHNTLNWTLSADDGAGDNDVLGYNIYRSDVEAGPWNGTAYATVGAGVDTYVDMNAGTADTTYWWYVVRAYDADYEDPNVLAVQEPGAIANTPPNAPTNPSPADTATGVALSPTMSVDVSDPDADAMTVYFYDSSGPSLIGSQAGVASGGTASVTWAGLSAHTTYNWYAVADDGIDTTQSTTWSFTTLNNAPTADAGLGYTGYVDHFHTFDGTGSSDPDGDGLSYTWTFTYNAAPQTLVGVSPTFNFQIPGDYTVTLTVDDGFGGTDVDSIVISVSLLTHNVAYTAGWNLISFAVNTEGGQPLATVFADEWSNIQAIQYYDGSTGAWKLYEAGQPGWMNSLKAADETKGYWVNFIGAGDGVLAVQGKAMTMTTVNLYTGWNLVGVPAGAASTADALLAGTGYDGLQKFDSGSPYNIADMIGTELMVPGSAYWVHVPATISYPVWY